MLGLRARLMVRDYSQRGYDVGCLFVGKQACGVAASADAITATATLPPLNVVLRAEVAACRQYGAPAQVRRAMRSVRGDAAQ